jgi:3-hydroxybutyryl-CoA dehydrogenase
VDINTVAIIGGGRVGSGIAIVVAKAGLKTILTEETQALANEALEGITREMDAQIARWGMTNSEKKLVLTNLNIGDTIERSAQAQIVIMAVPDDLDLQKQLFRRLDSICQPDTIFTTSASVLSITELATVLRHPEKMLGLHFLNPVLKTKLVEIVRGFQTSDDTYETGKKLVSLLGKKGIKVFETPGFVTTRLIIPLINEAMYALMEGVASADDIDTAMKLGYNMQTGPLELADRIGLDRVLTYMEHLFRESGELKFRPCPLIKKYVRAQELGVKSGKGFFEYNPETGKLKQNLFEERGVKR